MPGRLYRECLPWTCRLCTGCGRQGKYCWVDILKDLFEKKLFYQGAIFYYCLPEVFKRLPEKNLTWWHLWQTGSWTDHFTLFGNSWFGGLKQRDKKVCFYCFCKLLYLLSLNIDAILYSICKCKKRCFDWSIDIIPNREFRTSHPSESHNTLDDSLPFLDSHVCGDFTISLHFGCKVNWLILGT